jgi:hypothetical protein
LRILVILLAEKTCLFIGFPFGWLLRFPWIRKARFTINLWAVSVL